MSMIELTPIPAPRIPHQYKWSDQAKRYYAWRDQLRALHPAPLPACLSLKFWLPLPKRPSKRRGQVGGARHQQTPDLDNMVKACMDALAVKDHHVWYLSAMKRWSPDRQGRIEVREADGVGRLARIEGALADLRDTFGHQMMPSGGTVGQFITEVLEAA